MSTKKEKRIIPVRGATYERLAQAAHKAGEQIGTFVDAAINSYLDAREREARERN